MPLDLSRDVILRWDHQDPAVVPLLKDGGIDVVLAPEPQPRFKDACASAGIRVLPESDLTIAGLNDFRTAKNPAAYSEGLWPGIQRTPVPADADALASASRMPWLDSNGYRVGWLRAVCPGRPPVLAYKADASSGLAADRLVPFDSLELALIEARVLGGNYVLSVDARYRAALLERRDAALADWKRLGATAAWLKRHAGLFGLPPLPQITALVDDGDSSVELLNMLFRHNAAPAVEPAYDPPKPDPAHRLVVVAAGLKPLPAAQRSRILAHADAGSIVVTDRGEGTPWWLVNGLRLLKDEKDRETFSLGRGRLVAYKEAIADPSEFALDVIDLATHPRRALRLWNALSVIAYATAGPPSGPLAARALLIVVNYGRPAPFEILCRVHGVYDKAVLIRPDAEPATLAPARRGEGTEVILPQLRRLGVVLLG